MYGHITKVNDKILPKDGSKKLTSRKISFVEKEKQTK